MNRMLSYAAILCLLSLRGTRAMGLDLSSSQDDLDLDLDPDLDRGFIVATGLNFGNVFGINLTNLLPLLALGAAALLPLLCVCALSALLVLGALSKDSGHSGYYSSYSDYSRALGLDSFDWEAFSVLDWLSMGEEAFRKLEPTNPECHKRVICELHQSAKDFGTVVRTLVDMLGYLRYAELLSLPPVVKSIIAEYGAAADNGRSLDKDCADLYAGCNFSLKAIFDKYSKTDSNKYLSEIATIASNLT